MESNLLSINRAVTRGKAEGLPVTETALRRWVKTGEVRAVYAGKKALIYWPNLIQFLTGDSQTTTPTTDKLSA